MSKISSVSTMSLELLSKENYNTWSRQMKALLRKNNLWDYVNRKFQRPNDSNEVELEQWRNKDNQAKLDLILSICPSELKQIYECETSRDIWIKLESICAPKSQVRKVTLLKQLMRQCLGWDGDVKYHLGTFFDIVNKLEKMNVAIHGDLLAIMLLQCLPASYEDFKCAIESRDELPAPETLKTKIIEENEIRKQSSANVVTTVAASNRANWRQNHAKKEIKKRQGDIAKKHSALDVV